MRAVAYVRVADAASDHAQRTAIEGWAAREGVEIRAWQVDTCAGDIPIAERPGLVAAYRAIREHQAGILVAANAERFTHDELVAWLIERAALTEGAAVQTADGTRVSTRAAERDTEEGWTRGAIDLARAYDRVMKRAALGAHVRAALAEKRSRGERAGTIRYGYQLAADGVHVEPNAAEQAVITRVLTLSTQGISQRKIAAQLEAEKIVGRTGAPLRQTQIANILRR